MTALLIPVSQIASAHRSSEATTAGKPKPTIVLVHGAWASTSSWNGVIARLHRLGYTVYTPSNPLMGLTFDDAYLSDFLHSLSGPIVLVGHSYGGAICPPPSSGPWPSRSFRSPRSP